jgi:hypothetical protein
VNVFRHDDIAQHDEAVAAASPLQNLEIQITVDLVPEIGKAAVTTERQEM